jgi:acetyl esterase
MDLQAAAVLKRLAALLPASDPDTDDDTWLATFRYQTALLREFSGAAMPLDSTAVVMAGSTPIRLFNPAARSGAVLFHIHGGGGIAGSLDIHDPALRLLAHHSGWQVAAPDYRLAPDSRFPAMLEECYAALLAIAKDAPRIVVSGDSIGGTIATALAMLARDRDGPSIAGQLLLYPNTDLRRDAPYGSRRSEDGNIIAGHDLERQIDLYLGDDAARTDPLASPMLADLAGLPPAFVATAQCDPLRDEGEGYGQRLAAAGVPVVHHRYPGMIHAFLQMAGAIDRTRDLLTDVAAWLTPLATAED